MSQQPFHRRPIHSYAPSAARPSSSTDNANPRGEVDARRREEAEVVLERSLSEHHHHHHRTMNKYERFEAWLRDNGARFEMLELRQYDCPEPTISSLHSEAGGAGEIDEEKKEPMAMSYHEQRPPRRPSPPSHPYYPQPLEQQADAEELYRSESPGEEAESEMRGVHSRQHIPPHTICMSIPRKCLITVEMGQATPIGQAIVRADLDLDAPKHIFLMIYILWDRKVHGRHSFFHPYYDILPKTLSNMPIFWTPEELNELQGSYLLQQIHDRNQAIADDYQAICQIAPLEQICTLEEFKWARMCVCSRNFGLQIDGHRTSAMVPHADMLNHYRPRETKWTFDEDRQAFTITTLQHIAPGAQVFDSYGQKCNHRFLLNYGFAVEDNRELDGFCPNEVPLELYVHPEDPLFTEKLEFWTRGETTPPSSASPPASPGGLTANLYASAALHHVSRHFADATPPEQQQQHLALIQSVSVVKRVRVCVSNNESTRLLFSLLRALVCNEEELMSITSPVSAAAPPGYAGISSTTSSFASANSVRASALSGFGGADPPVHRSFAGLPESRMTATSFAVANSAAAGTTGGTYQRSCRDIRHPMSLRNERAAMRLLLTIVSRHLSQYSTSLAQDVADLRDEAAYPPYSNRRHAKIQVRGEKEVLHHFAHWARTALDVLDVIEEELNEERGSVEVKINAAGRVITEERPGFECIIRHMEEDLDSGIHHTISRYCADVLGSLRREEFKSIRRQRVQSREQQLLQQQQQHQQQRISNEERKPFGKNGSAYL